MKTLHQPASTIVRSLSDAEALLPPPWISETFALPDAVPTIEGDELTVARGEAAMLISARVHNALSLDSSSFERATMHSYTAIAQQLAGHYPVRFWNHLPGIHTVMDAERDRYMVFNGARFRAFEKWYGSADAFSRHVATASGVGHSGTDLVVHCLATREPGEAIENPRQVAAYRYSRRYGPLPPCFARATTITPGAYPRGLLLVGGTASIRGEDSIHAESLALQLDETFENLATLVSAASAGGQSADAAGSLACYRHLRIYYRCERDIDAITTAVGAAFGRLVRADYIPAELCRQELLVEIEGVAQL
jgi:chorismate lyase/3-hydroxybenzoate synthase